LSFSNCKFRPFEADGPASGWRVSAPVGWDGATENASFENDQIRLRVNLPAAAPAAQAAGLGNRFPMTPREVDRSGENVVNWHTTCQMNLSKRLK
jgi:hypothetical protein